MKIRLKHNGRALGLLTKTLIKTADKDRAEASRWYWRDEIEEGWNGHVKELYHVYHLTPLGILHRLIGLSVVTKP